MVTIRSSDGSTRASHSRTPSSTDNSKGRTIKINHSSNVIESRSPKDNANVLGHNTNQITGTGSSNINSQIDNPIGGNNAVSEPVATSTIGNKSENNGRDKQSLAQTSSNESFLKNGTNMLRSLWDKGKNVISGFFNGNTLNKEAGNSGNSSVKSEGSNNLTDSNQNSISTPVSTNSKGSVSQISYSSDNPVFSELSNEEKLKQGKQLAMDYFNNTDKSDKNNNGISDKAESLDKAKINIVNYPDFMGVNGQMAHIPILGNYILINKDFLDSSFLRGAVAEVVAHEGTHAWQEDTFGTMFSSKTMERQAFQEGFNASGLGLDFTPDKIAERVNNDYKFLPEQPIFTDPIDTYNYYIKGNK